MATEGLAIGAGLRGKAQNAPAVPKAHNRPRPFGAVVRDLLIEREIVTAIGNPNWMDLSHRLSDVSYESLRKAVTGERHPGMKIMEAVAAELGVEPTIFWEYQLAQAQRAFDPTEVGDDEAYANLLRWLEK